jgi:hypothetical protein
MSEISGNLGSREDYEDGCHHSDSEGKSIIDRYELRLIDSIKVKSRTQKSISRRLGLNVCIICELIDGLLMKGHIERHRKRRLFFWHRDLFSATLEGMAVSERARRANNGWNKNSLKRLLFMVHSSVPSHK